MKTAPKTLVSLNRTFSESIDLFICSASFEQRCLSIAENLDREQIGHVLVAKNQRFSDAVDESLNILQERFSGKVSILVVDSADPVLTAKNIVVAIREKRRSRGQRVLIDITTFTHETLLILFHVCNVSLDASSAVDFLYAPASEYSIGDEPSDKWLSKGISEVRSVMGYPGGFAPSRGTHLIVLAGFEDYRTLSLIQELEPSLVSIGYGDSTEVGTEPHQVTNETKVSRIRSLVGNVKDFVFSCYDAVSTEETIREVVQKNEGFNTIVAPMNTKISTLGAGRAALRDESIQICYAQADIYNYRNYSRPGDKYYHHRFDDYPAGGLDLRQQINPDR